MSNLMDWGSTVVTFAPLVHGDNAAVEVELRRAWIMLWEVAGTEQFI